MLTLIAWVSLAWIKYDMEPVRKKRIIYGIAGIIAIILIVFGMLWYLDEVTAGQIRQDKNGSKGNKTAPNQSILGHKGQENFCGISTNGNCTSDADCVIAGCSAQVCQSLSEEPIATNCEYKDCYDANASGLDCKCVGGGCKWAR